MYLVSDIEMIAAATFVTHTKVTSEVRLFCVHPAHTNDHIMLQIMLQHGMDLRALENKFYVLYLQQL